MQGKEKDEIQSNDINPGSQLEQAKPKKKLNLTTKAKAFIPEEELSAPKPADSIQTTPSPEQNAKPYSLMDDLKTSTGTYNRHAISGNSASFIPLIPSYPQMSLGFNLPTVEKPPEQTTGHIEPQDTEQMMNYLVNSGSLIFNPKVYNQLTPGQDLSYNLQMQPGLQEFVEDFGQMSQEEMADMYEEMMMQEYAGRPEYSFGDNSHHHTYSHLDEEEDWEVEDQNHEMEAEENPLEWGEDPEAAKRREEIRKNFFNPDYKDCECCKGYISNCGNEICKNLGVCHCVVRKQNEESSEINDNQFIQECSSCSCCYGFVYRCPCVMQQRTVGCKCLT